MLALDAVYGTAGENVAGLLSQGGMYVVYEFLSKEKSTHVSDSSIWLKQTSSHGFRLSSCIQKRNEGQWGDLWAWLLELFSTEKLQLPAVERVEWEMGAAGLEERLKVAVDKTGGGGEVGTLKQVFVFRS